MYWICNKDQLETAIRNYCRNRFETHDRAQVRDLLMDFLTSDEARAAKIAQGQPDE